MILHKLEAGGFRCFPSTVAITLDPQRINVLHGKNGSGKSTLVWALIRCMFDTHRAGGKHVEALRPWGTALAPSIVVEFEDQGKRYRLEKNFLDQRGARLSERKGSKLHPLALNEKAEELVREIMLAEDPSVGLSKPEKWGLARALFCPQEQLRVEGFDGRVLGSIQELLGRQAMDEGARELQDRVEAACQEYWTAQGKPKGGKNAPLWARSGDDLRKLEESLAECRRELGDLQSAQETAQRQHEERAEALTRREKAAKFVAARRAAAAEYTPLAEKCGKLKAQSEGKLAEAGKLDGIVRQVAELREKQERTRGRLRELDEAMRKSSLEEEGLAQLLGAAEKGLQLLAGGDPRAGVLGEMLEEAERYNGDRQRMAGLESRMGQIAGPEEEIRLRTEELDHLSAPGAAELSRLEKLAAEEGQLRAKLDGALLHVHLTPEADRGVEVLQGSPLGTLRIAAGADLRLTGSPVVELRIEGFGRVTVTGPATSALEIERRLAEVTEAIRVLTAPFGSSGVEELQDRRRRAVVLETEIAGAVKARLQALEGRTAETLQAEAAQLRQELQAAEGRHPEWKDSAPDAAAIRREITDVNHGFEERRAAATRQWQDRQGALAGALSASAANERERQQLSQQYAGNEEQLTRLAAGGVSDAERQQQCETLALEAVGLKRELEGESGRLQQMGGDPRPLLEQAEAAAEGTRRSFEKIDRALHEQAGTLKEMLDRAPYERCAQIEEEIEEIRGGMQRDKLRAEALLLIRTTLQECEEEATAGVAAPVAQAASELLRRIAGDRMQTIRLGDELAPYGVAVDEAGDDVDLGHLSGGEREQVHVAVRLALAEVLTKNAGRRELVVLDDVLTFTDEERLKRVLKILEEMRVHAQFLILTCHPERYKALKGANFINVEKLRA